MDLSSQQASVAVFQFIELLTIISILCIAVVILLMLYLKNKEKTSGLEKQNEKNQLIMNTITQVQENERNRISRDLHDTVTQDIRTALLYIRKISTLEESENFSKELRNLLQYIQKIEDKNLHNIRMIIRNLTPPEIENADFLQLVSDFCASVSEQGGIPCNFHAEKSRLFNRLSTEQKLHIFRIIQESVNNSEKHSGALEICVIAREETQNEDDNAPNEAQEKPCMPGGKLVFLISDDGHGFCQSKTAQDENTGTHLGLKGIKSRAAMMNAALEIKSNEETGTQIKLTVNV